MKDTYQTLNEDIYGISILQKCIQSMIFLELSLCPISNYLDTDSSKLRLTGLRHVYCLIGFALRSLKL